MPEHARTPLLAQWHSKVFPLSHISDALLLESICALLHALIELSRKKSSKSTPKYLLPRDYLHKLAAVDISPFLKMHPLGQLVTPRYAEPIMQLLMQTAAQLTVLVEAADLGGGDPNSLLIRASFLAATVSMEQQSWRQAVFYFLKAFESSSTLGMEVPAWALVQCATCLEKLSYRMEAAVLLQFLPTIDYDKITALLKSAPASLNAKFLDCIVDTAILESMAGAQIHVGDDQALQNVISVFDSKDLNEHNPVERKSAAKSRAWKRFLVRLSGAFL